MKVKILFFLIVIFSVSGCQEAKSQKYSSITGRFTIQFPNSPSETEQEIETDSGKLFFYSVEAKDKGYDYAVTFIDYPLSVVQEKGTKAVLEDASEGGVSSVSGTLLNKNDIVIGEYSGINQTVETVDKIFASNFFLVDNRLYMIVVTGPKEAFPSDEAQGFLDSFELLPEE